MFNVQNFIMNPPVAYVITSLIVSALAVAASITMGIIGGVQQASMARYNKKVADNQAELERRNAEQAALIAENQAIAEEQDSKHQAELERKRMERVKALNRAREGAGGFAMTGTPLMMQIEAAENIEMNHLELLRQGEDKAAQIRFNGSMGKYNHQANAMAFEGKAKSYDNMASNAMTNGIVAGVSSGVKGAASWAGSATGKSLLSGGKV